MDCIFCSIIKGDIPSTKVFENDHVLAFKDINPMAKVHIVIIPKFHMESMDKVYAGNSIYVQRIFEAIPEIARAIGLTNGYRVISNCGKDACQSVQHLHFHLLGGEQLPEKIV